MSSPLFSILIPSIPSRMDRLTSLLSHLNNQIESNDLIKDGEVEIISVLDNKIRSIGHKRDALVQLAQGEFLAFVDDDDWVSIDYLQKILSAIMMIRVTHEEVDVIVFNQRTSLVLEVSGEVVNHTFTVKFGLEYDNQEAFVIDGVYQDITRKPFHICVWRTTIAQSERFPDASYGEDWHWCKRLIPKVRGQRRIDESLHIYKFDTNLTEAEPVFPKE